MKKFIVHTVGTGVRSLALGWALMLLFGSLHGEVSSQAPAIGYWPSVWFAFLALWIVGTLAGEATGDVVAQLELEDGL